MQAVILAAGEGTRMLPLTATQSKPMLPVANKPMLERLLKELYMFEEILVVTRKGQKDLTENFEGKVRFVYQQDPKGTAHALWQARSKVSGSFLVVNADVYTTSQEFQKFFNSEAYAIACVKVEDPTNLGTLELRDGYITKIEEKTCATNLANAGIYLLDERIFDAIEETEPSPRNEYELTDSLQLLLQRNVKIKAYFLSLWLTYSYPWDLLDLNRFFLEKEGSQIAEDVKILSNCEIEEPVAIGAGTTIGPNSVIRKYTSIGKNCRIGRFVEVKNSILMDGVKIPHLSYVGDSILGRNCNLGAGTIVANLRHDGQTVKSMVKGKLVDTRREKFGCVLGDGVKTGINTSIYPGRKIWPHRFTKPSEVVREDIC